MRIPTHLCISAALISPTIALAFGLPEPSLGVDVGANVYLLSYGVGGCIMFCPFSHGVAGAMGEIGVNLNPRMRLAFNAGPFTHIAGRYEENSYYEDPSIEPIALPMWTRVYGFEYSMRIDLLLASRIWINAGGYFDAGKVYVWEDSPGGTRSKVGDNYKVWKGTTRIGRMQRTGVLLAVSQRFNLIGRYDVSLDWIRVQVPIHSEFSLQEKDVRMIGNQEGFNRTIDVMDKPVFVISGLGAFMRL